MAEHVVTVKVASDEWSLDQLHGYIVEVRDEAARSERSTGMLNWHLGKALFLARGKCPRGKWNEFLVSVGYHKSRAHAYHCIKIAREIPEERAREMTYSEMLRTVYQSYKGEFDALENGDEGEEPAKARTPKQQPKGVSYAKIRSRMKTIRNSLDAMQGRLLKTGIDPVQLRDILSGVLDDAAAASKGLGALTSRLEKQLATINKIVLEANKKPQRKGA
jgi:hypothetical protein